MTTTNDDEDIVKALAPDAQRLYDENKPEILCTARQLLQGTIPKQLEHLVDMSIEKGNM